LGVEEGPEKTEVARRDASLDVLRSSLAEEMPAGGQRCRSTAGADDVVVDAEKPADGMLNIPDQEQMMTTAVKEKLTSTKERLSNLNVSLKEEVAELSRSLDALLKERDALRASLEEPSSSSSS